MSCTYCKPDDADYGPGKCVRDGCKQCCGCERELVPSAVVMLGELAADDAEERS